MVRGDSVRSENTCPCLVKLRRRGGGSEALGDLPWRSLKTWRDETLAAWSPGVKACLCETSQKSIRSALIDGEERNRLELKSSGQLDILRKTHPDVSFPTELSDQFNQRGVSILDHISSAQLVISINAYVTGVVLPTGHAGRAIPRSLDSA